MGARYEDVFDAVLQALKTFEDDNLRASCFALHINFSQSSTHPLPLSPPCTSHMPCHSSGG